MSAGPRVIGPVAAGIAVAVPVAVFLVSLWVLHDRPEYGWTRGLGPVTAAIVLLTPFTAQPVLWTGVTLASLVAVKLVVRRGTSDRDARDEAVQISIQISEFHPNIRPTFRSSRALNTVEPTARPFARQTGHSSQRHVSLYCALKQPGLSPVCPWLLRVSARVRASSLPAREPGGV